MSTFNERFREISKDLGLKNSEIARALNTSHTTVARWLKESQPRSEQIAPLASLMNVNVQWLMSGQGEKEPVNLKAIQESSILAEDEIAFNEGHNQFKDLLEIVIGNMPKEQVLERIDELIAGEKPAKARILIDMMRKREKRES